MLRGIWGEVEGGRDERSGIDISTQQYDVSRTSNPKVLQEAILNGCCSFRRSSSRDPTT